MVSKNSLMGMLKKSLLAPIPLVKISNYRQDRDLSSILGKYHFLTYEVRGLFNH